MHASDLDLVVPSLLSLTPPAMPVSGTALADLDSYFNSDKEQLVAENSLSQLHQAPVDM